MEEQQPVPTERVGQPHLSKNERKRLTKRLLGASAASFVLGSALTAGILHMEDVKSAVEPTPRTAEASLENADSPRGKYLQLSWEYFQHGPVSGYGINFAFDDNPHVFETKGFQPVHIVGSDKPIEDGDIIFRRLPISPSYADEMTNLTLETEAEGGIHWDYTSRSSNFEPRVKVNKEDIRANHVVPVFGDTYRLDYANSWTDGTNASFYMQDFNYKGTLVNGGVWWALSDENGNYVDPTGNRLKDGEKPYYAMGFHVELQDKYFGSGVTSIDIMEPGATLPPPNPLP